MFQCFETLDMGPGIFTFFCFSLFRNVSKQLKSVDLENFLSVSICFSSFTIYLYVSMFRNTRYGAWIFTFFCFSLFRNVSKQLKVWT